MQGEEESTHNHNRRVYLSLIRTPIVRERTKLYDVSWTLYFIRYKKKHNMNFLILLLVKFSGITLKVKFCVYGSVSFLLKSSISIGRVEEYGDLMLLLSISLVPGTQ